MAVTLSQAQALTQDKLVKGIIEELIKQSPLMARYPFVELNSSGITINREDEDNMGSVGFYAPDGIWVESSAATTPATFRLSVLGGQCDVPGLYQRSMSNINDQMAEQVKIKTKLMAHTFDRTVIYGNDDNKNEFDGLHVLIPSGQQVHLGSGSTGAALTFKALDQLVGKVKGGKPDLLLMNSDIHIVLTNKLRTMGALNLTKDEFGELWTVWGNNIPIIVTDWIPQTETISSGAYSAETGGNTSSIFAIRFGAGDGLAGLQNGGIATKYWEDLEDKDAARTRIRWYVGQILYSTKAVAVLDGVTADDMS